MAEHTISISEAQSKITRLPEQFDEDPEAVTVTRHGKPVMAILPFTTYTSLLEAVEALQETLDMLRDEELMVVFRESVKDLAEGRVEPLDDALKELGWG
ncbi:MAG: type II toxin-antitoxin system Phd/YefM family antitoxin [Ktedonobacteraceae bacterium]